MIDNQYYRISLLRLSSLFRITIVACLLTAVISVDMYAQLSNTFFGVRPENHRFLRYNYIENEFDSSVVLLICGEFTVTHSSTTQRVNLEYLPSSVIKTGSSTAGIDTQLAAFARTESFIAPASSMDISFYREMSVSALPCDSWVGSGSSGGGGGSPYDRYWGIGTGKVPEQTEFVLQLVRTSDDVVLAVIDSVGVTANSTTAVVPYYGTNPNDLSPTKTISISPSDVGKNVYIRISPRRYGSTPLGMRMRQISSWFNWSAAFQRNTSGGFFLIPSSQKDSSNQLYFDEVIAYCDSVKTATGQLPENIGGIVLLTSEQDSIFRDKYFIKKTAPNSAIYYEEKGVISSQGPLYPKRSYSMPQETGGIATYEGSMVRLLSASPQPAHDETFRIQVECKTTSIPVSIHLLPYVSGTTRIVWEGVLSEGRQDIVVHREGLAAGVYYLSLHNAVGEPLSTMKILLQ